jgi:hypothetical protein
VVPLIEGKGTSTRTPVFSRIGFGAVRALLGFSGTKGMVELRSIGL